MRKGKFIKSVGEEYQVVKIILSGEGDGNFWEENKDKKLVGKNNKLYRTQYTVHP